MTEKNGTPTDEMVSSVHTYLASRLGPLLPEDVWVNWTDVARAVLAKYESGMNGTGENDVPVETSSTRDPARAPVVVVNSCDESVHELELRFSESDHITDEQLVFQLNDTNTTVTFARVCENVYRAPDIELRPGDTLSESAPAAATYAQGWRDRRSTIQTDVERAAQAVMAAANCDVRVDDADFAHVDGSTPCHCQTKLTELDEIEVTLRYIARVRSMLPSAGALKTLDDEEARLKAALRKLNESEPKEFEMTELHEKIARTAREAYRMTACTGDDGVVWAAVADAVLGALDAEAKRLSAAHDDALAILDFVAEHMNEFAYQELHSALQNGVSLCDDCGRSIPGPVRKALSAERARGVRMGIDAIQRICDWPVSGGPEGARWLHILGSQLRDLRIQEEMLRSNHG